jgi:hypothetical protein
MATSSRSVANRAMGSLLIPLPSGTSGTIIE